LSALINQFRIVFDQLKFSLKNDRSGKIHLWSDREIEIDPSAVQSLQILSCLLDCSGGGVMTTFMLDFPSQVISAD
jgi:hypothetical protein